MIQTPDTPLPKPERKGLTGSTAEVLSGTVSGACFVSRECGAMRVDLHETQKGGQGGLMHPTLSPRSFSYVEPLCVSPTHAQMWGDGRIPNTPCPAALPSKEVTV